MDSINVSKRYALAIYDFATENDEVFERAVHDNTCFDFMF